MESALTRLESLYLLEPRFLVSLLIYFEAHLPIVLGTFVHWAPTQGTILLSNMVAVSLFRHHSAFHQEKCFVLREEVQLAGILPKEDKKLFLCSLVTWGSTFFIANLLILIPNLSRL